jgi:hypothetical protein
MMMTDVYISCASADLDRVRSMLHGLRGEGWNVLCDPHTAEAAGDAEDPRSISAGAVIVTWTASSRESMRVRAEASNALYKNKLIQIRLDDQAPPRPFDQVDSVDLSNWWGWPDDAGWRAVVGAVRLFAGPPGITLERPQVLRHAGRKATQPTYLEPERTPGPAAYAVAAAGVAAVVGAAAWFMLPSIWRNDGRGEEGPSDPTANAVAARTPAAPEAMMAASVTVTEPVASKLPSSAEAAAAWAQVDRKNPAALRSLAAQHSGTNEAESAKALLRVLDAQGWVTAVNQDTEAGYRAYLAMFPADSAQPGSMVAEGARRLTELGAERAQAIASVQEGLASAGLYKGAVDGAPSARTAQAASGFAERNGLRAPDLVSAAPRDIRAFSDVIAGRASTSASASLPATASAAPAAGANAPAVRAPVVAAATVGTASQPLAAAVTPAAPLSEAEDLAQTKLLQADEAAWQQARAGNSVASYRTYLASFPRGVHAAEARRAATPAAFSLDALLPDVRTAVSSARQAESRAQARAAEARQAANQANAAAEAARNGQEGAKAITAPDGDRFEAEVVGTEVTGFGVRVDADPVSQGDIYRGQLRAGLGEGVGVYEYADNPNNAQAGALRYEGEHAGDSASGSGVTFWKNGDRYAGDEVRGVFSFKDGRRYEGQIRNGASHGVGVVWSASGEPVLAGRWENGQLVEPVALPPLPAG